MNKKIIILGTLDTKGEEFKFIKDIIEKEGLETIVIDVGVVGEAKLRPNIDKKEVAIVGGSSIEDLIKKKDRGYAMEVMMKGSAAIVKRLSKEEGISGIISLGGSGGTSIASYAMRALEVGIPKVMVSTLASGDTRPYVGEKDITMIYSVVDISGINTLSSKILSNAAYALIGMVKGKAPELKGEKPLIGATMFGVTTKGVNIAKEYLENNGYEVLVFHATGAGGRAMEDLIRSGYIKGVLDMTTTEWCDEVVGGVLNAGPNRLEAASDMGIPQVVAPGALDMVNFGPIETVPEEFKKRNLYKHNATVTLMRTTKEENIEIGKVIGEKLNRAKKDTALFIPLKGVSAIDAEGEVFYGYEEDKALFNTLKETVNKDKVQIVEMNNNINDEEFAIAMAKKLINMMEK
ncbi:UPF0261 family protein [Clostridium tetani]|uniref:UPF0261 protein CTC_01794 n=1 Tax=Clostridium tetani (strain Massachusetts / E88) TaxID=212717 RepID=Y1794_CLOTE|nr:Tm-1-like ATP-binding domain-containing protein [Clostridium tetani]Q893M2.2 RecName: Full=UPF0261 protein CTC_01794 [Clostridium tetani E88]KGI37716.1 hypothetical protein KY52_09220 [Clostridium tetani]KGI39642.1 hypothetical protein LA33_02800 [Clostridium tetani ATCC 9441]KGI45563.1 hypothetical protein KY54_05530 [Clostridium tetani]KHO31856.1 hypothetical protein OR63_09135 [Clostridium tetani]KIG21882.1 hypothetical protein RS78_01715 [Clostridium tetani]